MRHPASSGAQITQKRISASVPASHRNKWLSSLLIYSVTRNTHLTALRTDPHQCPERKFSLGPLFLFEEFLSSSCDGHRRRVAGCATEMTRK